MGKDIKLNFAFLCDLAFFGEGGKLSIIGIFKNINGTSLPITHPQMFIVTSVNVLKEGNHKETIKIVNPDNESIIAPLEFNFSKKGEGENEFGVVGRINSIRFDKEGMHKIQILINDTLITEMPLEVRTITAQHG